ncbi:MAG: serine hydrolase [Bacteroidales bacterium]|nr:serine hydrolase [Bacteroidales bacterium]
MKQKLFRISILLLTLGGVVAGFNPVTAQSADTLRKIDEIFAQYHNGMPGLSVAIARDGKTIYSKAFGLAEMEHRVPNTTETTFECGSVSKQFVAASILLLAQDGKLALTDDVRKYVPELPQYDAPITIKHLLTHTSGLKDWGAVYSLTGWPRTTRVYTQELSFDIVFRQKSLNFSPGEQYSYSNSNYVMLVLITERVSGKKLAEFTRERLFKPLGMKNTMWRDNFRDVVIGRAVAYSGSEDRFLQNMPFENVHGPGGLLSTTGDLLIWNSLLADPKLFTDEFAAIRIESGKLNNGDPAGYAAGLMTGARNGFIEISHSGSTAGYRAWLAWYPEKRLSVAILSNHASSDPVGKGRAIADVFLGQPERQPATSRPQVRPQPYVPTASLTDYSGTYYSEDADVTYKIEVKEDAVWVYRKAGDTYRLNPVEHDAFTTTSNGSYRFERDRRGKVTGFKVSVSRADNVPFRKIY